MSQKEKRERGRKFIKINNGWKLAQPEETNRQPDPESPKNTGKDEFKENHKTHNIKSSKVKRQLKTAEKK